MTGYRGLNSGEPREPTWSERARAEELRERGIEDVFVEPSAAPPGFWEALLVATHWYLVGETATDVWKTWTTEVRFATGWPEFGLGPSPTFKQIVGRGQRTAGNIHNNIALGVGERLSAIEHLVDVVVERHGEDDIAQFREAVNERARHFRVGVRLEGSRFIPITSEHLHREVVQPALVLLRDPRFRNADTLYRKAFDRALGGDPSGALTASTSAVEELLRIGLRVEGLTLEQLLTKARQGGWMIPAAAQVIVKLAALREASDAHEAGTDSFEVAMLGLHLAGSILRFLGDTLPGAGSSS